jgi:hypothetical protein
MNHVKKTSETLYFRIFKITICLSFILTVCCDSTISNNDNTINSVTIPGSPPPWLEYIVSGTIRSSDSTHRTLKGIKVILKEGTDTSCIGWTDSLGKYSVKSYARGNVYTWINTWGLYIEDVDDGANGLYLAKDSTIFIPTDSTYDSTRGEWLCNRVKAINLEMEPK